MSIITKLSLSLQFNLFSKFASLHKYPRSNCKASSRLNMKPQTIMLFCIGMVQSVAGLETLQSPGILIYLSHVGTPKTLLICMQDCVSKCWDNSKYVSACLKVNETQCLCEDADFQSVRTAIFHLKCLANRLQLVLQCLYSQCQTTQFGSAVHRTLSACSDSGMNALDTLPPLIRNQGLRKRSSPSNGYVSGHLSVSAVKSVARRSVSASAYVSARPTRIAGRFPTHA